MRSRSLRSIADCLRIRRAVLYLPLDETFHADPEAEFHLLSEFPIPSSQRVDTRTRLHGHNATRLRRQEAQPSAPKQHLASQRWSVLGRAAQLKAVLVQVVPDDGSLIQGRLFLRGLWIDTTLAHCDAVGRGASIHHRLRIVGRGQHSHVCAHAKLKAPQLIDASHPRFLGSRQRRPAFLRRRIQDQGGEPGTGIQATVALEGQISLAYRHLPQSHLEASFHGTPTTPPRQAANCP